MPLSGGVPAAFLLLLWSWDFRLLWPKAANPQHLCRVLFTPLSPPVISWENSLSTHWVEDHGEEELAPLDALVQLLRAPRVVPVEDRVGEQPTGLPWENLEGE